MLSLAQPDSDDERAEVCSSRWLVHPHLSPPPKGEAIFEKRGFAISRSAG
jgi:hypothetical protein